MIVAQFFWTKLKAHKSCTFFQAKKKKSFFNNVILHSKIICKNNLKTQLVTFVCHTKIHICAKYGQFITNYSTWMNITWSFDMKSIHVYRLYALLWRIFHNRKTKNDIYMSNLEKNCSATLFVIPRYTYV